jgi:hypothetical protein
VNYNPVTDKLEIDTKAAQRAYHTAIYALRHIRALAGLPLDKYDQHGPLEHADHAQIGVLQAMEDLGIKIIDHMRYNELDLRNENDLRNGD